MLSKQNCIEFFNTVVDRSGNKEYPVINPKSGREIKLYKEKFKDLVSECYSKFGNCHGENLGWLAWDEMSCYRDTVIFSLFYKPNRYMDKNFLSRDVSTIPIEKNYSCNINKDENIENLLNIQHCLRNIAFQLRFSFLNPNKKSSPFFNNYLKDHFYPCLLENCRNRMGVVRDLTSADQDDPNILIQFLFEIFPLSGTDRGTIQLQEFFYRNPKDKQPFKKTDQIDDGPIVPINKDFMDKNPITETGKSLLQNIINPLVLVDIQRLDLNRGKTQDQKFKYSKDVLRVLKFPKILIFNIRRGRTTNGYHMMDNLVFPTPIIKNSRTLFSIICKTELNVNGGHYIAFFRCKEIWYKYNDMNPSQKHQMVGSFENLLRNSGNFVLKKSVCIFYLPVEKNDKDYFPLPNTEYLSIVETYLPKQQQSQQQQSQQKLNSIVNKLNQMKIPYKLTTIKKALDLQVSQQRIINYFVKKNLRVT